MRNIIYILFALLFACSKEQTKKTPVSNKNLEIVSNIERVDPPNWWVGMRNDTVQLLIKEKDISKFSPTIDYPGVSIVKINNADSPNYMFLDIYIDKHTNPGKFNIVFTNEKQVVKKYIYALKKREKYAETYDGFDSADAIYLITPDRFANGDKSNDIVLGMREKTVDRSDNYKRHGGDIQGIINSLGYIEDLGFTAIWPTPLLTNDSQVGSYHGYAITDHYQVDPRFGSLQDYRALAKGMADKNMKLLMDQVVNHCGIYHWWMNDLPFDTWINYQKYYEKNKENWSSKNVIHSNHKRTTNQDLYASKIDENLNLKGWFVAGMPDLNHDNPFLAKYLIQNSIWWIETLQLGGIRQDTYPYSSKEFMSRWAGAIKNEYPNFTIVGEEWSYNPLLIGYWQQGAANKDHYESNLPSTMDFAMQRTIIEALNEGESWDRGLIKMYEGLANDFHYASPKDLTLFLDNHDMSRVYTQLGGDLVNTKIAISYLLTLPRIPQIFYGTEVLMDDFKNPGDHGLIRSDFPGGWDDDTVSVFREKGLSTNQLEMKQYLKTILNFRKSSKALQKGRTIHFAPKDGVYVLFRMEKNEIVVHIINKNIEKITLELDRFKEIGLQGKQLQNIQTSEIISWKNTIELEQKGSILLTTKIQ